MNKRLTFRTSWAAALILIGAGAIAVWIFGIQPISKWLPWLTPGLMLLKERLVVGSGRLLQARRKRVLAFLPVLMAALERLEGC